MTTVAVIGCTHAGTFATTSILAEHPDWTVHVFERNGTLSFLSPAASPCGWGGHAVHSEENVLLLPCRLAEAGATMHMRTDRRPWTSTPEPHLPRWTRPETPPNRPPLSDKLVVTTGSRSVIPPIPRHRQPA